MIGKSRLSRRALGGSALGGLLAMPSIGRAQAFQSRSVRPIVPCSPGGGTDTLSRLVGQRLGERWNQTVLVENRPGASGVIGTEPVARATPDGHTLAMIASAHAVNPGTVGTLPHDCESDAFAARLKGDIRSVERSRGRRRHQAGASRIATKKKQPGRTT